MSIVKAIEELAGAGLIAAVAEGDGNQSATASPTPAALIERLRETGLDPAVDDLIGDVTRELLAGTETRNLDPEALNVLLYGLAGIVAAHAPPGEQIRRASASQSPQGAARRIALDVFTRARSAGSIAAAGITDNVALFVLDRVLFHVLRNAERLASAAEAFAALRAPQSQVATPAAAAAARVPASPDPGRTDTVPPLASRQVVPAGSPAPGALEIAERRRIRDRYELSEAAEARLLALIDQQGAAPAERLQRLEALASWLLEARAQLMRPTNEDGELRRLKTRAAQLLADGDLAGAMETLKLVRRELRDGRRRIEARLEEEVSALKAQMLEEARATARLAELALARRDHAAAAELFFEAADCLPKSGREEAWRYHLARADALLRKAEEDEDGAALSESLAAYGSVLKLVADGTHARGAALANLGLGRALIRLAATTGPRERIDDAITALRKSVALISADEDARTWIQAHAALARALSLSARHSGAAGDIRGAADALRAARASAPADLPVAEINAIEIDLGTALLALADIERTPAILAEAEAALRSALERLDRAEDGYAWAMTRVKLATAELGLGDATRDGGRLDAAISGLEEAIALLHPVRSREEWLAASITRADALAARAELDGGNAVRLKAAIAAYRSVLEAIDREAAAMDWAAVSLNLGSTLIRLGEREDKRGNWFAAAAIIMPALEIFEANGAREHAEMARRNLKRFHDHWEGLMAPGAATAPPRLSKVS